MGHRRAALRAGSIGAFVLLMPTIGGAVATSASAAVAAAAAPAPAAAPAAPAAPVPVPDLPQLDKAELDAFLDTFVGGQLDALNIPGALVVVADRRGLVTARGIGYADLATRTRFDVDRHLVPLASISKLFVATAVMQQVERGTLDLDADASSYLQGWRLDNPYGGPVTLRHLLTHRSGMQDKFFLVALKPTPDPTPLETQLRETPPGFIYAPGTYSSYSNYGIALAGAIAARAGGAPSYDAYLERNVLEPLGMTSTTSRRPLPAEFAGREAKGYITRGDIYTRGLPGYNTRTAPAGSVMSTAADMARFMAAWLADGEFGGQRILRAESVAQALTRGYQPHPALSGMGLVFTEKYVDGIRGIGHGGDGETHHTDLVLFPEQGFGLFVAYLSNKGPDVRNQLVRAFVRRFITGRVPDHSVARPVPVAAAGEVAGAYRWFRNNFTTVEKVAALGSDLQVAVLDDTRISFASSLGNRVFVHTGAGVFESATDGTHLTITPADDGSRMILRLEGYPFMTAFRLRTSETTNFVGLAAGALALGFLAVALAAALRRAAHREAPTRVRRLAVGSIALALAGFAWLPLFAGVLAVYGLSLYLGVPPLGRVVLLLPLATLGGALALGAAALRTPGARGERVLALLAIGLTLAQFALLWSWHLVGFQFR